MTQFQPNAVAAQAPLTLADQRVSGWDLFYKVGKDCFTGLDGESYALGKILSVPTLMLGLLVPFGMIAFGQSISLSELGVFEAAVVGGATALIRLTNAVEPTE